MLAQHDLFRRPDAHARGERGLHLLLSAQVLLGPCAPARACNGQLDRVHRPRAHDAREAPLRELRCPGRQAGREREGLAGVAQAESGLKHWIPRLRRVLRVRGRGGEGHGLLSTGLARRSFGRNGPALAFRFRLPGHGPASNPPHRIFLGPGNRAVYRTAGIHSGSG